MIEGKARLWGSLQDVQTEILLNGDNVHFVGEIDGASVCRFAG